MHMYDILNRKRLGKALTRDEIQFFVRGCTCGEIPNYQTAALLMAICIQGMDERETAELTLAMTHSGEMADLSRIPGRKADKHSTGGVGDKTTLIAGPLAAACGVTVAKMSGRGLGYTGGTIDKLEAIPGFSTSQTPERFAQIAGETGLCIVSQSGNLAPADKKLYALRDLTATVESIPLIASSIMSKKLASGAHKILLDVKFGSGAFMQQPEQAELLARTMVQIGNSLGRQTVAVLSSMEEPLGYAVGNSLEVQEAMDTLQGHGPADLTELCLTLSGQMIFLGQKAATAEQGYQMAAALLEQGAAWQKFEQLVNAQGGNLPQGLPQAQYQLAVCASQSGVVSGIDAKAIGHCSMLLGAGRESKHGAIDLSAGVLLRKKTNDTVKAGEQLAILHYNAAYQQRAQEAALVLQQAYQIDNGPVQQSPLVWKILCD